MKTLQIQGGDVVVGGDGRPIEITGAEKLQQDILEDLLVGTLPNGYGAGLGDLIGQIHGPVSTSITFKVVSALEAYQYMQSLQPYVAPEETLKSIVDVTSKRISGSHTDYQFEVVIRSGDPKGNPIKVCLLRRPTQM